MDARRRRLWKTTAGAAGAGLLAVGFLAGPVPAQPPGGAGLGERLGQGIDGVGRGIRRGAMEVTDSKRRGFETVRGDVQRMTMPQRVYSRLHWDRALVNARIEVQVLRGNVVLLRGTVPDAAARRRAVDLASTTADVREVVDELVPLAAEGTVAPPTTTVVPADPSELGPAIDSTVNPVEPASAGGRTVRPAR